MAQDPGNINVQGLIERFDVQIEAPNEELQAMQFKGRMEALNKALEHEEDVEKNLKDGIQQYIERFKTSEDKLKEMEKKLAQERETVKDELAVLRNQMEKLVKLSNTTDEKIGQYNVVEELNQK